MLPTYRVLPAPGDAIRIVPLHVPTELIQPLVNAAAPATRAPQLAYGGGALLTAVEVFTIFWGAAWANQQAAMVVQLNAFFDFILTSPLLDQLSEYSVTGKTIGHGRRTGTITLATPAPQSTVSDATIQHFLQHEIATNPGIVAPTPNALYFIYLPPGVSVTQGGGRSCQAFCGYHSAIQAQLFYAVMPFPGCNGCTGGLSPIDALTSTSSHELCEAITDAVPGQGWYDNNNGEIGDICAWKSKTLGPYAVQLEWSNKANQCA